MPDRAVSTVLLCDKPAGVTSHDVVARVRRERGCKAGHAGTLDPFATGLLLVLLGAATRLQRFLTDLPKTYLATARLGWRSSTGDPDGELTETGIVPSSLSLPTGKVRQRVPMTSAVRVGGERLYRKAHRGETVETPQREVEVYRARAARPRRRDRPLRDRVLGRHLCPHPDRDPRRRLLRRAAADRDRPLPGRGRGRGDLRGAGRRAGPRGGRGVALVANIDVTSLPDAQPRPRHVAIGTFDGVHRGHQAVIEGADTVLTFDPHPLEVIHPAALPKLIMPFGVKRDVIEGLGVRGAGRDPLRPRVRDPLG